MDIYISRRKLLTFILLGLGNFFTGASYSIIAPFYPAEAEKKGMSATEFGMVFSVYELIGFLFSPFFGKYLHKLGPRLVLNLGMLLFAIGSILFGTLDNYDPDWFLALSFIFRITQAIGTASYVTASFAVIAIEFPESMAQTFAALETAFGAGLVGGPPIGGVLFQAGGYPLPFIVMGGIFLLTACLSPFLTPSTPYPEDLSVQQEEIQNEKNSFGIMQLLKIPGAALAALNVLSSGISNGFMSAILEPHIRQFNLTPVQVTGVFVALMGSYAVSAPAWGWVCDKLSITNFVSLAGSVVMFGGCLLIGPAPFLPFGTILWVTCVGCVLQGIGTGALNVSSFLQLTEWSKKNGFPDDVTTYGLTSGVWFSMLSLGSFIGPIVAGILYDHVGFRMGSLFCIADHFVMILLQITFILWVGRSRFYTRPTEIQPLLGGP